MSNGPGQFETGPFHNSVKDQPCAIRDRAGLSCGLVGGKEAGPNSSFAKEIGTNVGLVSSSSKKVSQR